MVIQDRISVIYALVKTLCPFPSLNGGFKYNYY
jgi:hypothetical protein